MSEYDSDSASTDPWAAAATTANGIPGLPGLPTGSTGQTPAPAPAGPRAESQPLPAFTPPPLQAPTPGAPASPVLQTLKDLATGNFKLGDYKGGPTVKTGTDDSRDLGLTEGQKRQNADKAAQQFPTPNSPYSGMY